MNPLEGVDTTLFGDMAWALTKMLILFIFIPGFAAGLICRYLLRLRGKIVSFFVSLAGIIGFYYLATNFDEVYNWLL